MAQRSILAGTAPNVIIKAGGSVSGKGYDSDQVLARSASRGDPQVERRSRTEIGRARAAIGDYVLFDVHLKLPGGERQTTLDEAIAVQIRGSGEVLVPLASNLKVYAGKDIDVQGIRGQVDAYAGAKLNLQDIYTVGHASAGGSMNLLCEALIGDNLEFKAGGDLRFHVRDLDSARIRVKDLGGYWEGRIGAGEISIYLKCGGDAALVTDRAVEALPPEYILGNIERPDLAAGPV
jgi:hypothetical protein